MTKKGARLTVMAAAFLALAAAVVVAAVVLPRGRDSEATRTLDALLCDDCNLVVISITNTRKDHLGLYGYGRPTSPRIDAFFKDALVFDAAFAPASWTLPVAASLFTGIFPYRHGVMERLPPLALSPDIGTLAEALSAAGYRTGAFTGSGDYQRLYGFDRGFDVYLDRFNYRDYGIEPAHFGRNGWEYGPVASVLPLAMDWLARERRKTFLFIQGYDTHCPFEPEEPFRSTFTRGLTSDVDFSDCLWTFESVEPVMDGGRRLWPVKTSVRPTTPRAHYGLPEDVLMSDDDVRYMVALYDAEIAQVDESLARLFDTVLRLGLEKNTVFVLLSEHGDLFGEHGRFMRGGPLRGTFYEPVLGFPLAVRHPRVTSRIRVPDLVQTVDLLPTLLALLGVPDPQRLDRDGEPIVLSVFGEKPTREYAFAATHFTPNPDSPLFHRATDIRAVRTAGWKLIRERFADGVTHELYDLAEVPPETTNLYEREPERAAALEGALDLWSAEIDRRRSFPPVPASDRVELRPIR